MISFPLFLLKRNIFCIFVSNFDINNHINNYKNISKMKKALLLMTASMTVVGLSAQSLTLGQKVQMAEKQQPADVNFTMQKEAVSKVLKTNFAKPQSAQMNKGEMQPKRSVANGVYYKQPAGTMFQADEADGRGYSVDFLRFPAYFDVPFYDESARPANSTWTLSTTDLTEYVEEDGRTYLWSQGPLAYEDGLYSYPVLTLSNKGKTGVVSYSLGDECRNDKNAQASYDTKMTSTPNIIPLTYFATRNRQYNYYGWSLFNEKHYLFGTGAALETDKEGNVVGPSISEVTGQQQIFVGAEQKYPAPISPLYVESIDLPIFTFASKNAIPEGKKLTLAIYDVDSDEPFIVMSATGDDLTYIEDGGDLQKISDSYGDVYMGNVHFSIKGEDAFGTATEEPFVLDSEFVVRIWGFDEVEIGMGSCQNYAPDALEGSGIICDDGVVYHFSSPLSFDLSFNGLFDTVRNAGDVETTSGEFYPSYYVEVEEDGSSSHNAIFSDLEGALFYTGCTWFSEDGDENYSAFELPDWITSLEVSVFQEPSEGELESVYFVNFTAEALPADVKGRGYFVYLQGRGVYSEMPIFVFQGDADTAWDDAIANENDPNVGIKVITMVGEKKAAPMVNLFGQQVSDSFKGIVVVDGKKQIRY